MMKRVALAELEYWGLSVSSLNLLDRAGYLWLDDLVGVGREELERLSGWGPKRTEELVRAMTAFFSDVTAAVSEGGQYGL